MPPGLRVPQGPLDGGARDAASLALGVQRRTRREDGLTRAQRGGVERVGDVLVGQAPELAHDQSTARVVGQRVDIGEQFRELGA